MISEKSPLYKHLRRLFRSRRALDTRITTAERAGVSLLDGC